MKIAIFNVHNWERDYLQSANNGKYTLKMFDTYLTLDTVDLAKGCDAICIFTEDNASAPILDRLHALGVKYVALRSAGFNNIDVAHAKKIGYSHGASTRIFALCHCRVYGRCHACPKP
ncbi:hypothetical protein ACU8V7_20250 [Zobellia nedashkovskayae]